MTSKEERRHETQSSCTALARKWRRNKLKRQLNRESDGDESSPDNKRVKGSTAAAANNSDAGISSKSERKPHITGIKKQSRYDPGVPMTKEELVAWRKEARRVRNRESAAASRRKTKDRISELEEQLDYLQSKYDAAMERILDLEATNASLSAEKRDSPKKLPFFTIGEVGQTSSVVSPCPSSASSPPTYPVNIPSSRDVSSFLLPSALVKDTLDDKKIFQLVENSNQRVNEMIRPQA